MFARIIILLAFIVCIALFLLGKTKPRYSGIFGCIAVVFCVLSLIFSVANIRNAKSQQANPPADITIVTENTEEKPEVNAEEGTEAAEEETPVEVEQGSEE